MIRYGKIEVGSVTEEFPDSFWKRKIIHRPTSLQNGCPLLNVARGIVVSQQQVSGGATSTPPRRRRSAGRDWAE